MAAQLPAQVSFLDEAERTEHVPEVKAGGLDRDQNFPWLQGARRQELDLRLFEYAVAVRGQHPVWPFGEGQSLPSRGGSDEPRGATAALAVCDVVFFVWIQQFV